MKENKPLHIKFDGNFTFSAFPGYIEIRYGNPKMPEFCYTVTSENEKRALVFGFQEAIRVANKAIQNLSH